MSNAPAKTEQQHPLVQLRKDIKAALPTFGLPDQKSQERMSSVLMVAVEKNPDLVFADRQSLISAVRQCASHGVLPDNSEATLQIYKTKVKVGDREEWIRKVQYNTMVRGIVKRVLNSGKIDAFWAELVYDGEEFTMDISHGDRRPSHSPDYFRRTGEVIGAYAVAKYANGSVDCEVMTRAEINKVRAVAKTQNVWEKWFEEKAKVAVMRRLAKRLPLSSEDMAMIMNEQEHDLDRSVSEAPQSGSSPTLAQRLTGEANDAPESHTDSEARDVSDVEDAEVVDPHKFDKDSIDPFTDEYTEGVKAQQEGKVESDCPYENNTLEHNNWLGGWLFAMKQNDTDEGVNDDTAN